MSKFKHGDEVWVKGTYDEYDTFINQHYVYFGDNGGAWLKSGAEILPAIVEEPKPVNDWIPCSERTPKDLEIVFVQIKYTDDNGSIFDFRRTAFYDEQFKRWYVISHPDVPVKLLESKYTVVAWQPLPEKYIEPEPIDIFEAAGFSKEICELANKTCEDIGCKPEVIIDLLNFIKERI